MQTDLSKQTKYYWKEFNNKIGKYELTEIQFNKENWFYVQLDATIRTSFLTYNCPLPPYVIGEKLNHHMTFYVVRDKIENVNELLEWSKKWFMIESDLDIQAKCNSNEPEDDEDWIHFEFKLI